MGTSSFILLILILATSFSLCSADSEKLILKSYDLPYCVVINQNVSASNCTWHNGETEAGAPVRFLQQQITVHRVQSSETVDNTSPEVYQKLSSNDSYLLRVNQNVCLIMTNSGQIGTGKCTIRKARFIIRPVYITNLKDVTKPPVKTQAYAIELRSSNLTCIGFPSRTINSALVKKPCNYQPENVLGQLWTFCRSDGHCNQSPKLPATLATSTTDPSDDNVTETVFVPRRRTIQTFTSTEKIGTSVGSKQSEFAGVMILLYSTLAAMLLARGI